MSIGIGMIGTGGISRSHSAAYSRLKQQGRPISLIATADIFPDRAAAHAAEFGYGSSYSDYRALLDRADITAVNICTSNRYHAEVAIAAAAAGKHILLEKPMAMTVAEADDVIAACRQAGVKLMVGQTMRFDAINWELKELVTSGAIGEPVFLNDYAYHGTFWAGGWRGWQIDVTQSGGHFVHNGIHDIDLASWIMGASPTRVYARGLKLASPDLPTFDCFQLHLCFANGASALVDSSYSVVPKDMTLRGVHLLGTDGEANHDVTLDGGLWIDGGNRGFFLSATDGMYAQNRHWIDCLEFDREPLVKPEQSRKALEIAFAAEQAAHTGEVLTFEEMLYV